MAKTWVLSGFQSCTVDAEYVCAYCLIMEHDLTDQYEIDVEMRNIIEEARVILPGVQALFGFQTIAVFNDRFADLAPYAKTCHIVGLVMVIIAVAMVMTPAVYYRTCRGHATKPMISLSSRMIRGALAPLALGMALDMFTVIFLATEGLSARLAISITASVGTLALLGGMWFIFPSKARKMSRPTGHC